MKGSLNFDYTKKSPVAFLPIIACPEASQDAYLVKNPEIGKVGGLRVIPPNHKLQVNILLTMPESDYNQNLGIFQVRADFLAANGRTLASLRRPCIIPELDINLRGFIEGTLPTACLKVVIEQRAEFLLGAGIPEIYESSVSLESELSLVEKLIWNKTKGRFSQQWCFTERSISSALTV
ncbi:seipin-2-like [Olea europaea subsp. europaea]|uniref:Seipin-2-like n=1 Tax=Olea europaea subsp. europaea TaxID=158383 RepID=A0A8S0P7Y7_OLEEU|nr:seipin-2-like [Olea europaea subsp. europaea]